MRVILILLFLIIIHLKLFSHRICSVNSQRSCQIKKSLILTAILILSMHNFIRVIFSPFIIVCTISILIFESSRHLWNMASEVNSFRAFMYLLCLLDLVFFIFLLSLDLFEYEKKKCRKHSEANKADNDDDWSRQKRRPAFYFHHA